MATPWCRLWADMPNDPKWRTVAKVSGQRISDVIAVYVHMMVCASNASERGRTQGWCDEDVANALDMETAQIEAIRDAMQGRVLDEDYLKGWDRRQSVREDENASARAKAWREKRKAEKAEGDKNSGRTQANASERKETLEVEVEVEVDKRERRTNGSRLPADWKPTPDETAFCKAERPDLRPSEVAQRFYDYWTAIPGAKGRKVDWTATWRNWVRAERPGKEPIVPRLKDWE